MRTPLGIAASLLATGLLAACATVSRDSIVLLPKADGSTGAIAATRGGEEVVLDSAYASARHGAGGKLQRGTEDKGKIATEFSAALAAMPSAAKSYTVYFHTGSDEFTDESKSAVATMLEEMRQRPSPEVAVIGHTDLVGSDAENDALSLQRAERVKEMLIALGIPPGHIKAVARGAREPIVATERGVAEPQNRRVEVSVR